MTNGAETVDRIADSMHDIYSHTRQEDSNRNRGESVSIDA